MKRAYVRIAGALLLLIVMVELEIHPPTVAAQSGCKTGEMLFASGFDMDTQLMMRPKTGGESPTIGGVDNVTGFDWWEDLPRWSGFIYNAGPNSEAHIKTELQQVEGRDGKQTRAMYMQVQSDYPEDGGKMTRNSYALVEPEGFDQGYVRYWLKLQPDLMEVWPETKDHNWRQVMEIWHGNEPGDLNYRVSFGLHSNADRTELRWSLQGERMDPDRGKQWSLSNDEVPVPIGEWFLMEVYYKRHETDGRVWWAVNGQELFDYRGITLHDTDPSLWRSWQIFKLYHGKGFVTNGNGPTYQWVDDVEWWSNFPPGVPAACDGELVQNGGFEALVPEGKQPVGWQGKRLAGDKAKCLKVKQDNTVKQFTPFGECAYRIKSNGGERSALQQKLDYSALQNGDTLTFSLHLRPYTVAPGSRVGRLRLKYTDGEKLKLDLRVPENAGTGDDYISVDTCGVVELTGSRAINKFKVQVDDKGIKPKNKFLVDAVSVVAGQGVPCENAAAVAAPMTDFAPLTGRGQ